MIDNYNIGLVGVIGAGKTTLTEAVQDSQYSAHFLELLLEGNFWVPQTISTSKEGIDQDLFQRYAQDPQRYAFEFQVAQLTNRFLRHKDVESNPGVNFIDMPLAADRWGYGEANRENMGASFTTYATLFDSISPHTVEPDVYVYLRIGKEQIGSILERIRTRGRPEEKALLEDPSYLLKLIDLYEQFPTRVQKPVIVIDASKIELGSGQGLDNKYLLQTLEQIALETRKYCRPPRLTLDEWEAVDYNRAQTGAWNAQRQLRQYLTEHQTIITFAGPVGVGKTGMAELLSNELDINLVRELGMRNDTAGHKLLSDFLKDKPKYAYDLQKHLLPKRLEARIESHQTGRSFVEDRSPVEDQTIFWRRLHQQKCLSDEQLAELKAIAQKTYASAPKSNVMIQLTRPARECRQMILKRGRPEEVGAWPEAELKAMERLYEDHFEEMKQYKSHSGPELKLDMTEFDPRNAFHKGYLWQEVLHSLLEQHEQEQRNL